jgi:hypothetical protein
MTFLNYEANFVLKQTADRKSAQHVSLSSSRFSADLSELNHRDLAAFVQCCSHLGWCSKFLALHFAALHQASLTWKQSGVWGSDGGEYEDGCILSCSALYSGRRFADVSEMMKAAGTSETSVNFTRLHGAITQNTAVLKESVWRKPHMSSSVVAYACPDKCLDCKVVHEENHDSSIPKPYILTFHCNVLVLFEAISPYFWQLK